MRSARVLMMVIFVLGTATLAADDWIERGRIRAGWIFARDGVERLEFFRQYGMNALIVSARDSEAFSEWAREAKQAEIRLFGVVGASFDGEEAGMRRCVFSNGYESVLPCPLEERYWDEVLIDRAVQLAREGQETDREITGILIDWEMYANSRRGGQIYFSEACYCDSCFGGFLEAQGRAVVTNEVAFADRVSWLREQGLSDEYHPHLQRLVREAADRMREAVAAVDPDFYLGFYPVPHNWHLVGVAQGLGTLEQPMILWSTTTYGGGGPSRIPDDWAAEMQRQEVHCYYVGGMLLRMYSAANLAKNIYEIARKSNGYWLFTVHTLCIAEEQQRGDFHLCAGTPDEYLDAIATANRELDSLGRDPDHVTPLEFVPEPVRYRHPGFDIGRFEAPDLVDLSTAPRGEPLEMPPLTVINSGYLMMQLSAGEEPALVLDVTGRPSVEPWGVSFAVLDPGGETITTGRMPPDGEFSLTFRAEEEGLHTVVVTPGHHGRCRVLTTTVPYAHWTWRSYPAYEVAGPGGTLHFVVPRGLEEFAIDVRCRSATAGVQLTVLNPDGEIVVDQPTDPLVRNASLIVSTDGKDGGLWALKISPIEGRSYRSVEVLFAPELPAAVTLSPDFVFEQR